MLKWELERTNRSIGHFVCVNSFFSASLNENVAEIFTGSNLSDKQEVSVLIRINVDLGLQPIQCLRSDERVGRERQKSLLR